MKDRRDSGKSYIGKAGFESMGCFRSLWKTHRERRKWT